MSHLLRFERCLHTMKATTRVAVVRTRCASFVVARPIKAAFRRIGASMRVARYVCLRTRTVLASTSELFCSTSPKVLIVRRSLGSP